MFSKPPRKPSLILLPIVWMMIGAIQTSRAQSPVPNESMPKLQFQRWSGPINVPDPVAISVADNGDVYVTQTQRRKIQDLDIRAHGDWIPDDVGLNSVGAKREFYHRVMAIGGDQATASKNVTDVNEDGTHDWRDLTVISEKIHRLVDKNGDGTADEISLFAEDFKTEVTGIAAGVMHWEDSVWATIAPDVWKLTDTTGDGMADQREIMATGFGVHIAYAGHDMHGLTIGPDGKVYWSIGDKGIAVTTADRQRFDYPNQGGVMRCNVDGSDFEVYAHGLRNVQEFAFDQFGNMFGVDNDADKPGEKERFVWIVDQMDAGWRCNYQYRGDDYNPWTDEKLWQIAQDDHPAYLVPPIQNYIDGPAGFKFNPGAALSSAYKDFFFLTGAPNGLQYAFRTEPLGDSFKMADSHRVGKGDPIVGIAFAPDGGLYGVDWGGGYPLNQTGAVIRIDVPDDQLSDADRRNRQSAAKWLAQGFDDLSPDLLTELLSHVDQRVRLRAQFALAKNNQVDRLLSLLSRSDANQLARVHCVWGIGQVIRNSNADASVLEPFLADSDPQIRLACTKTLGETRHATPDKFIPLLHDANPHVQVHAALALGRRPTADAVDTLVDLAKTLPRDKHYLRHAIVTALAACAQPQKLAVFAKSPSESLRLVAVLALRRIGDESVAAFLSDRSNWVATAASRAIHDDKSIDGAMESLAKSLAQDRSMTVAMALRSINANFRIGGKTQADRVMEFAANQDQPIELRVAACEALGQWKSPPLLDRVDGRRRDLTGERNIGTDAAATLFAKLVTDSDLELRVAAVKASRALQVKLSVDALETIAEDTKSPLPLRIEAINTLVATGTSIDKVRQTNLLTKLTDDKKSEIASRSVELLNQLDAKLAMPIIESLLETDRVSVRQACIAALAKQQSAQADAMLAELGQQFVDGKLPKSVRLDVCDALQERADNSAALKTLLDRIEERPDLASLPSTKFRMFSLGLAGGNAERGETLFRTDLRVQCSRCHRVGKKGSNIGPELTKIAKQRDANHLLRAIVYPSADIEPKYNAQTLLLADGKVVQGVIKSEDDDNVVIINSDGKEITIASDDIDDIAKTKVSLMPDMTAVLSPSDVRDLVAYLKTLR